MFVNSLAGRSTASIFAKTRDKVFELARMQPLFGSAYIRGRHYLTYIYDFEDLKNSGSFEDAEKLLLEMLHAMEEEAMDKDHGVAPWYYEELAKIYRKNKSFDKEVLILERFAGQKHARGVGPKKLLARLEKVKELLPKNG